MCKIRRVIYQGKDKVKDVAYDFLDDNKFYTTRAKIGIVLPIWNQKKEYIYECINSIESQYFRDFKLVIVIDGADIETVKNIRDASTKLTIPYKIIERGINKGIAFSLNEGFEFLQDCRYLTWISSDNRQYRNFLSVLVTEMDNSSQDTILVYSTFNIMNKNSEIVRDAYRIRYMIPFMNRPKEQILENSFIGPSFLFKGDAYIKSGRYDTEFETVEDYEFWIRLLQLGNIKFVPTELMDYRVDGEFSYTTRIPAESISLKSARASYKNRLIQHEIPKVTVIINAYNEGKYILQSVNSVLNQTYGDFQLIIIDDASIDGTWFQITQIYDKRIMEIKLSTNRGKAEAMNLALKYTLGRYVLELDGDDWLEPNTIETMLNQMEALPLNYAMCYANRRIWFQRNNQMIEGPTYSGVDYKNKYEVIERVTTHCPRMYRKVCLDSIGGWPDNDINNERNIIEDLNLTINLAEKYSFYYIDKTLYNQRRHDDNLTKIKINKCTKQIETLITNKLIEWGDDYKPVFLYNPPWISKVNLVPKR